MCFVAVAVNCHADFPFIVAANRDEYFARPSLGIHIWDTPVPVIAGKDLSAGGAWLGLSTDGRFAALTNCRSKLVTSRPGELSRGDLVRKFLEKDPKILGAIKNGDLRQDHRYGGFNLITGSIKHLDIVSNTSALTEELTEGVKTLSNHTPDTVWPKTRFGGKKFETIIDSNTNQNKLQSGLFSFLTDSNPVDNVKSLEDSSDHLKRVIFARGEQYGTRASTVILVDANLKATITEKIFGPLGIQTESHSIKLSLSFTPQESHPT
ncbi:MAG: NRDE family protein [Proteobacteria bacterium]|nr:NRDE family protein [Pseudomonadota bacterium]